MLLKQSTANLISQLLVAAKGVNDEDLFSVHILPAENSLGQPNPNGVIRFLIYDPASDKVIAEGELLDEILLNAIHRLLMRNISQLERAA